jgi:DNA polymerase
LSQLHISVDACRLCADIVCRRKQPVFGVGPSTARLVMFGEAPGAEEDLSGIPFVGAAGQLLDKILIASKLQRDEVYIMNTLKCRPPSNRTPTDSEVENCRPFFEAQLEILQPEYIICWGAVPAKALLRTKQSVGQLRGRFHPYGGAKVLVTYHPAYLLREPSAKKKTWEDMQYLMRDMGIPVK